MFLCISKSGNNILLMLDMGCDLLWWCGGPYGSIFSFEAQIHKEMKVGLPNKALIFCSHRLCNHFPSFGNEIDAIKE